jgi:hypothetical protein
MIAEVAQPDVQSLVVLDDASGRLRQHNLSTVCSCADPCRAADANSDIAVGMKMRVGGVQAHPHAHPVHGNERTLGGDGRRHGIARSLESDKEGIALGIDLVPMMGLKSFAEDTTMLRAQVTVRGTVPARQLRRALDVAKQESHRPVRQTSIHTARWYAPT